MTKVKESKSTMYFQVRKVCTLSTYFSHLKELYGRLYQNTITRPWVPETQTGLEWVMWRVVGLFVDPTGTCPIPWSAPPPLSWKLDHPIDQRAGHSGVPCSAVFCSRVLCSVFCSRECGTLAHLSGTKCGTLIWRAGVLAPEHLWYAGGLLHTEKR